MEFHATVIQARGLTIKPGLIHYFLHWQCLYHVRNMTFAIHSYNVFELLILPFDKGLSV